MYLGMDFWRCVKCLKNGCISVTNTLVDIILEEFVEHLLLNIKSRYVKLTEGGENEKKSIISSY